MQPIGWCGRIPGTMEWCTQEVLCGVPDGGCEREVLQRSPLVQWGISSCPEVNCWALGLPGRHAGRIHYEPLRSTGKEKRKIESPLSAPESIRGRTEAKNKAEESLRGADGAKRKTAEHNRKSLLYRAGRRCCSVTVQLC